MTNIGYDGGHGKDSFSYHLHRAKREEREPKEEFCHHHHRNNCPVRKAASKIEVMILGAIGGGAIIGAYWAASYFSN